MLFFVFVISGWLLLAADDSFCLVIKVQFMSTLGIQSHTFKLYMCTIVSSLPTFSRVYGYRMCECIFLYLQQNSTFCQK